MREIAQDLGVISTGPYMTAQRYMGLNKEVTRGTAPSWTSGTAFWIPISPNPQQTPNLQNQVDDSLRGAPADVYNDIPLVRHDEYDFKGFVYPDTFGPLLLGMMGGPDTVVGTVAPYTHKIPLLNSAESGSQPPSYSLVDVDLIEESGTTDNAKQMTAGQISQLDLDFAATGSFSYTAKYMANPFTEIVKPTASYSSEVLVPGYNGVITFGGSQSFVILKGTLSLKRTGAAPIFTIMGSQNPYRIWDGPFNVTGTFDILALQDDLTLINGLQYDKQVVTITYTEPQTGHSVYLQLSQVQFLQPKTAGDQPYMRVTTNFNAEANTTDAVTSYSPMTASVTNALSAQY